MTNVFHFVDCAFLPLHAMAWKKLQLFNPSFIPFLILHDKNMRKFQSNLIYLLGSA